jgi:hypothetical protein
VMKPPLLVGVGAGDEITLTTHTTRLSHRHTSAKIA